MKWLDAVCASPAENLAGDEALLDLCEEEGEEILRFWESPRPFVVLGYANKVESEVKVEECRRREVPILRRCTGGGTVVQGPGCLNYNITVCIPEDGLLTTVTGTNAFVMERNRAALEGLVDMRVAVHGYTDLAFAEGSRRGVLIRPDARWFKFSGNAQRRRRRALVFHGTILYDFNLGMIEELLRMPSKRPEYRGDRDHAAFVRNIPAQAEDVKRVLREAWKVTGRFKQFPEARLRSLVENRYGTDTWNFRQ